MSCPKCGFSNDTYRTNGGAEEPHKIAHKPWKYYVPVTIRKLLLSLGPVRDILIGLVAIALMLGTLWCLFPGITRLGRYVRDRMKWNNIWIHCADPEWPYIAAWLTGVPTAASPLSLWIALKLGRVVRTKIG